MKNSLLHKLNPSATILSALLLLSAATAFSQGFVKTYPVNSNIWTFPSYVEATPDGFCISGMETYSSPNSVINYRLTTDNEGVQTSFVRDTFYGHAEPYLPVFGIISCGEFVVVDTVQWSDTSSSIVLTRFNADGVQYGRDTVEQAFPGDLNVAIRVAQTLDGNIWVIGERLPDFSVFIQKFDPNGQLVFSQTRPAEPGATYLYGFFDAPSTDGGIVLRLISVIGTSNPSVVVAQKLASDGSVAWDISANPNFYSSIQNAPDGNFYGAEFGGDDNPSITEFCDLAKHAPNGDMVWSLRLRDVLGQGRFNCYLVIPTLDNGVLACGGFGPIPTDNNGRSIIAKFDEDGQLVWRKEYFGSDRMFFTSGVALPNGGFALSGSQNLDLMLLKIDSLGYIYSNALEGRLVSDANSDCLADATEAPLSGWTVRAEANGAEHFTTTDVFGHYFIDNLPGGPAYDINITTFAPSYIWETCPPLIVTMPDTVGATLQNANIAAQEQAVCPWLAVDVSVLEITPVNKVLLYVQYCNFGSGSASNAAVEVYLPTEIEFLSASLPWTQIGQTIHIELGNVPVAVCQDLYLVGHISSDTLQPGQSLCIEAHIFPDTFCYVPPSWSGASIVAKAECLGDSAKLILTNKGLAPTTQTLEYLIIDDDVVMRNGIIPIGFPVNGELIMYVPANNNTLRITSQQEPNHPFSADPSVAVEDCNGVSVGFVSQFSNQTGDPFSDVFCWEISGGNSASVKEAYPNGVGNEHFIEPGTPLTYVLRFQNKGTSVGYKVILQDTISPWLDPGTLVMGGSSHPYEWTLSQDGILTVTFDPITLTTELTDVEKSMGFVQFSIQMRPIVPLGTVIQGRASIRIGYNTPAMTNTVFHTVQVDFLEIDIVSTVNPKPTTSALTVFPNPATDVVTLTFSKNGQNDFWGNSDLQLVLTDALGRTVLTKTFSGGRLELRRGDLVRGVYAAKITSTGRFLGVGKVVWE